MPSIEPLGLDLDATMRFIASRTPEATLRKSIGDYVAACLDEHEQDIEGEALLGLELYDLTTVRFDGIQSGLFLLQIHVSKAEEPTNLGYQTDRWLYLAVNRTGEIVNMITFWEAAGMYVLDPAKR